MKTKNKSEEEEKKLFAEELENAMEQFESESEGEKARRNLLAGKDNYAWLDEDDFMVTEEEFIE